MLIRVRIVISRIFVHIRLNYPDIWQPFGHRQSRAKCLMTKSRLVSKNSEIIFSPNKTES